MAFTKEELANSTLISALTMLECGFCGFVSNDFRLNQDQPSVPCPHCNRPGTRFLFPNHSAIKILRMVTYFFGRAGDRQADQREHLAEELTLRCGRRITSAAAVRAATEIRERYQTIDQLNECFSEVLEGIRISLDLPSVTESSKAFALLMQFTTTNEEHQTCVVLTAGLLENLLREALIQMRLKAGENRTMAVSAVSRLRHKEREKEFRRLSGVNLSDAVNSAGDSHFYELWQETRGLRNRFLHEQPYAINQAAAQRALDLALNSFGVFAYLQNGFCLRSLRVGDNLETT